jgi:mRNA-degrading endonuclease toxin of MazEF toxin-antitoxin module
MEPATNPAWYNRVNSYKQPIVVERGDVWMVEEFQEDQKENTSVQRGCRPYLIVQSVLGSDSPVIEAAPISASIKGRSHQFIQNLLLEKESQIHYEQTCPVPRNSLSKKIGHISLEKMREMDMRLAIPFSLDKSSILHIEAIIVNDREIHKGEHVFWGFVTYRFFEKKIRFTKKDFLDHFGPDKEYVLDYDVTYVSEFLDSIQGIKFVYSLILQRENEVFMKKKISDLTIL